MPCDGRRSIWIARISTRLIRPLTESGKGKKMDTKCPRIWYPFSFYHTRNDIRGAVEVKTSLDLGSLLLERHLLDYQFFSLGFLMRLSLPLIFSSSSFVK